MNRPIFALLIVIEAVVGLLSLGLIYTWFGVGVCLAIAVVFIAIIAILAKRLIGQTKSGDTAGSKKTMRHIVAAMALPFLVALVSFIGIFVWLSAAI
ncbi:MAG: hypothetical protein IKV48_00840 [Eggerthellaceae bacterium]|nr:hypothetical protein [Eggerthellaceae bacterium]